MTKIKRHPDYVLLGVFIALMLLGILILSSASASFSLENFDTPYYFLNHQLLFGLLPGIVLGIILFIIPIDKIRRLSPIMLLAAIFALTMVFLPIIGVSSGGASRWVEFGPISFQPSEFLKPIFILYLASWLAARTEKNSRRNDDGSGYTFISFFFVLGLISLFLILQPDISTLGIIALTAILMYFLSNTPLRHTALMVFLGIGGLLFLVKFSHYRLSRLLVFLNPDLDVMGKGYQIKQALIAVGSGGIFGLGLGMSRQKFGFLPQSISDSVFAIFAEEAGFIGAAILVFLFIVFLWRGFKIAKEAKSKFAQLAALGISFWIITQAFLNIGSMIGLTPISGVPLPFVSYGGSALISEIAGVGVLLNISRSGT